MKLSEKMRTERIAAFQPAILDWADEVAKLEEENEALRRRLGIDGDAEMDGETWDVLLADTQESE